MKKTKITKSKVEMCAEAFIKAMDVFTELFDNEETTREERLEMLDELGWVAGEIMCLGSAGCELADTEMDFKDMVR